ncbi:peptidylprolyl isomerase [Duganella sp. Leaf126]|uniref:peptidylprolyl isomerase n=1 Tax=Duganella sp. Leaf126 TaxID=1736266 RepID=UPI0006FE7B11|nr:peptidylprolyl isomerase [Duganella sp. Leaf126]KQQ32426.1 peptidylprolyl isomerase [Duganella sp. Leaf126]
MMLKPARLLLAMIAVTAAPAFAQNLATVNGKAIPAAKADQMVKQVVAQGQQPDSPQLREMVKKELIGREVLLQEANKQGYGNKPDVKAAIDNASQSITINAMLADYVKKNPVKDADIKAEYDKYKAANGGKEYHSRHILVATEQEAKDIIAKLKAGGKFEELAKVSKDGSANNGGDLGWMSPGKLVKPFADAMVALKPGAITETPVKTEFGYHVIKLDEAPRDVQFPPFEQVKGQIAQQMQQGKIAAYRDELIKKAKVQ